MADEVATLIVRLEAKLEKYNKDMVKAAANTNRQMGKIEGRVQKGRKRVESAFRGMGRSAGPLIGGSIAASLAVAAKSALDYADKLDKLSISSNIGVERLQALRFAAEQTGAGADFATQGFERFNRRLGEFTSTGAGPAKDAFHQLGISVKDANGNLKPTEALLDEVMARLAGVENQAQKAAIAAKLFGDDAGPRMLRLLSVGVDGIRKLEEQARDTGQVLTEESIKSAVEIRDEWNAMVGAMTTRFQRFVLQVVNGFREIGQELGFLSQSFSSELKEQFSDLEREEKQLLNRMEQEARAANIPLIGGLFENSKALQDIQSRLEAISEQKRLLQFQIDEDPLDAFGGSGSTTKPTKVNDLPGKSKKGSKSTPRDVFGDAIKRIHERTRALESEKKILTQTADERLKIASLEAEISAREKAGLEVSMQLRMELADARAAEAGELERLQIIYDALNELVKEGVALTPEMDEKIKKLAATMGTLAAETEKVAQAEEARADASDEAARRAEEAAEKQAEVNEMLKETGREAIDILADLSKGTLEWEDALLRVLDVLIDMQENGSLGDILGGGSGGSGDKGGFDLFGSIAGLFSGFGGGGSASAGGGSAIAAGGSFNTLGSISAGSVPKGFAKGGRPPVGKMSMVGEEGPELFMPDRAGSIINATDTAAMLRPANSNTQQAGVTINAPVNINVPMTEQQITQTATQFEKALGRVVRRGVGRI